jgi:hypothetical protein
MYCVCMYVCICIRLGPVLKYYPWIFWESLLKSKEKMKKVSCVSGFEPFILPSQNAGTNLIRFKFSLHTGLNSSLWVLQKLEVSNKVEEVNSSPSHTIWPLKDQEQTILSKIQFVPRRKNFSSRLHNPIGFWCKWQKSLFVLR